MKIKKEKLLNLTKQKSIIFQNFYSQPFFLPFIFLLLSIISLLIYSTFYPIPTQFYNSSIGISSKLLNIGDRSFYLYDQNNLSLIKPSPLYPFILNTAKKFVGIWGLNEYSKLWNLIVISFTSILSLISLLFISSTAWQLFGRRVSIISSWIYVICPYTLFFSLNGSLTNYIFFGISYLCWIISRSQIFNKNFKGFDISQTLFHLSIASIYLSSLRVTGSLISIIILLPVVIFSCLNYLKSPYSKVSIYSIIFALATLLFILYQINQSYNYLNFSIKMFASEPGSFLGVERQYLRSKIYEGSESNLEYLKKIVFLFLWKISDFATGINDIRDTHTEFSNSISNTPLMPFLTRVFTGIFYFIPINFTSFLGIIKFRKILVKSGFWLIIVAAITVVSPSLIGVANSRYLYMVYAPFIIFSSAMFCEFFNEK